MSWIADGDGHADKTRKIGTLARQDAVRRQLRAESGVVVAVVVVLSLSNANVHEILDNARHENRGCDAMRCDMARCEERVRHDKALIGVPLSFPCPPWAL